jgi:hypothetical protein
MLKEGTQTRKSLYVWFYLYDNVHETKIHGKSNQISSFQELGIGEQVDYTGVWRYLWSLGDFLYSSNFTTVCSYQNSQNYTLKGMNLWCVNYTFKIKKKKPRIQIICKKKVFLEHCFKYLPLLIYQTQIHFICIQDSQCHMAGGMTYIRYILGKGNFLENFCPS